MKDFEAPERDSPAREGERGSPDRRTGVMDRLAATVRAEAHYEAPADVVARAKAIFARGRPEGVHRLTRILARLVYDSFRDPRPAGVRSEDRPSQALYEAGDFSVDLHLNPERVGREQRSARMVLVGQIADRRTPTKRLADLPVLLTSGKQVAACGISNEMGEFHLEYDPRQRMKLQIPVDADRRIEVPLHRFSDGGGAMRRALAVAVGLLCGLLWNVPSVQAGERFVLRASKDSVQEICETYGLKRVSSLGRGYLSLVEAPEGVSLEELQARLATDSRVLDFESDEETASMVRPVANGKPPSTAELSALDRTPTDFFGSSAWLGYVQQPAADLIGANQVRENGQTGAGTVVAVIDTGIDPDQPLLKGSLITGYDFTQDIGGTASEQPQLNQIVQPIGEVKLHQIVQPLGEVKLHQIVQPLPELKGAAFGHGTMVAGLIHLVAPEAKIMPLKAFLDDGTARTSDILRAIYYAVDNGAKVINMSFSSGSREIKRAIQFATNKGLICVGSAGNDGQETIVYPAALKRVLGVASTTLLDERADFSNYGEELVKVAAPGENVITTYPGGHYAAVSGTSFSAPLVSGAAAVLAAVNPNMDYKDAMEAFQNSRFISEDLGWGRIDIPSAVAGLPADRGKHAGRVKDEER